ncbi:MAG: altronate hydrolase [Verrucomicrobiales bacterium]|nr:altronate hydrolase [Verrucomicrobiales bacterium]|tara:strand:- start:12823 stop:14472 length:1650 start_codon:yes stop_codon:yes gene_type:complete
MQTALIIDPADNLGVALTQLDTGDMVVINGKTVKIAEPIAPKHKFSIAPLNKGARCTLYGVTVGIMTEDLPAGGLIHTGNLRHEADRFSKSRQPLAEWNAPDVSSWRERAFDGYHRSNGSVGTANYWIVIPMVFCENRNVDAIRRAFERTLGYERTSHYEDFARGLVKRYQSGEASDALAQVSCETLSQNEANPIFPNIDGIKFLTHTMGCGGTRDDANALCGLLAGYITHPNVAGATVLSLGCENAELRILEDEIQKRSSGFDRPVLTFRQQEFASEQALLETAIRKTFLNLIEANKVNRRPAALGKLCLGVECGGSDGFSGISANPTLGKASDRLIALGGKVILSEFPELCGVEQELVNRCVSDEVADRFVNLTSRYAARAEAVGSGFSQNPSPGNIKDGLITDAIKSAGAAKKGGSSPIVDALDYPEIARLPGLNLLCTPGGDVESTTAMAGAHANLIVFTTGLGTPTGNPICPVIKVSSSTELADRLPDLIDFNTGGIIQGETDLDTLSDEMLDLIIQVASGRVTTKAEMLGQNDFQPWKRDVSL